MAFNPSGAEQEVLELVNRMRQNPAAELDLLLANPDVKNAVTFFKVDSSTLRNQWSTLRPTTPLAWSPSLYELATGHSQAMIQADQQAHTLPGGTTFSERFQGIGYQGSGAENIFAFPKNPLEAHAGMAIDWGYSPTGIQEPPGHRNNLMNPVMQEVGIAIVPENNPSTKVGPLVMTQNFGSARSSAGAWLLGVIYKDQDRDQFYDSGEGVGNVSVKAVGSTGQTFNATSLTAGGYQLQVPAGSYTVTFSGGQLPKPVEKSVVVAADNVKLDLPLTNDSTPTPTPTTVQLSSPKINNSDRGPQTGVQPGRNGSSLDGSDLDDTLTLGAGLTSARGLSGHDVIQGSDDRDDINGNAGMDTILGGAGSDDALRGGKGSDAIDGEAGDDVINGNNDNDTLLGGSGDDLVRGGKEDDVLFGGVGNDRLVGDLGQDWLTGNAGSDTFVLRCDSQAVAASVGFADVILDFRLDQGDRIGLTDGKTLADLKLEYIPLKIDGSADVFPSTAIRLTNGNYIGVIAGITPTTMSEGTGGAGQYFVDASSFA